MKRRTTGSFILSLHCLLSACSDDTAPTAQRGGSVLIQISGEELATDGFRFPTGSEVTFSDGWELTFSRILVTVGNVTLAENPDLSPTDQSRTGAVVAEARGPWAVDLHEEGSHPAAGDEGSAIPLATLDAQNLNGGAPFEADRSYAFSYDLLAASDEAVRVNFAGDTEAELAYAEMIEQGYSVLFMGTATFRGEDCDVSDGDYDFDALPKQVAFRLGFATPVSNRNCQNQENEGEAFPDENFPRGVQVLPNRAALAQITLHVDHPWFGAVEHEPALYFDQMAARLVGREGASELTLDDFVGVDPTAFTDGAGAPLPHRHCDGTPVPAGRQRAFDIGSLAVDPLAEPADALRDYRDFVHYVQSTQGHMNGGEGLCFTERRYPSPR